MQFVEGQKIIPLILQLEDSSFSVFGGMLSRFCERKGTVCRQRKNTPFTVSCFSLRSWRTVHYGPAAILVPNVPSGLALRQDQVGLGHLNPRWLPVTVGPRPRRSSYGERPGSDTIFSHHKWTFKMVAVKETMALIIIRAISWEKERSRLFSDFCANVHCIRKETNSSSSLSIFFVKVKFSLLMVWPVISDKWKAH